MVNDEDYIIKMPPGEEDVHPDGVGWFLYEMMIRHKNKIAQICAESGVEETYDELLKRSIRTAIKMRENGIKSNDVISMCTYNHLNSLVPSIAGQFLCCPVSSLDPTLSQNEANHLMSIIRPKLIFVSSNAIELIEEAINNCKSNTEIIVFGNNNTKYVTFDEYVKESNDEIDFKPTRVKSLKDTSCIFFSSGTTGLPKGICCNHYQILMMRHFRGFQVSVHNKFLTFSSPYWISATIFLVTAIANGTTRIIPKTFDPDKFWFILKKYKIYGTFMTPAQIFDVLNVKPKEDVDTSSLKYITIGGSPVSKHQYLTVAQELPNTTVLIGYGLTEAGGLTCTDPTMSKEMSLNVADSCGKPLDGISYKIVDMNTRKIVGPNKLGELWVKVKWVMNGYYNNTDSSDCFDKDGYLSTGDIMYYDENLNFYYVDRIKEMLKYKGWQLQPTAIENVILQHPAVQNAVVVGLPHSIDGDYPLAFVILKSGHTNTSAEEIKRYANERLHDRQRLRGGLKIVKELPLTPSGKIQRRKVRELLLNSSI